MIIKNANIVLKDETINGYIEFDKNKIVAINKGNTTDPGFDAKGLFVLPAFIDSHTHGGYGLDFNMLTNRNHISEIQNYIKRISKEGVGSVLATTVTCSDKDLDSFAKNYTFLKSFDKTNIIKGWYIEGPYISSEKCGAHAKSLIRSIDVKKLKEIAQVIPSVLKVLAVAPEYKDNISKISKINKNYLIAIGHSNADYNTAMKAFNLKGQRIIHLYNAMPDFNKRRPNILNAIFNNKEVKTELICDGIHVAPETILNTYNILGSDRIMIISDSLMSKGLKDGKYHFWNMNIEKQGVVNYIVGTKNLAGGSMPFNLQVTNFGKITKCSMQDIVKVSSFNAAKSLRLDHKYGTLNIGANSSFVLLDKNYHLKHTFINGELVK